MVPSRILAFLPRMLSILKVPSHNCLVLGKWEQDPAMKEISGWQWVDWTRELGPRIPYQGWNVWCASSRYHTRAQGDGEG